MAFDAKHEMCTVIFGMNNYPKSAALRLEAKSQVLSLGHNPLLFADNVLDDKEAYQVKTPTSVRSTSQACMEGSYRTLITYIS
jgi:hypothetical protein